MYCTCVFKKYFKCVCDVVDVCKWHSHSLPSPSPPLPPSFLHLHLSPSFPSYLPSFLPCNSLLSPPLHTSLPSSILCHHFLPPFLPSLSLPSSLPPLPSRVWSRCMGAVDANQYKSLGGQYQIQGCPTIKVSSNLLAVCIQCKLHITYEYMQRQTNLGHN